MKSNDFDRLAFVYDRLAKLVFGRSIIDSQKFFLPRITERSTILILGGGSGWILTELFKIKNEVNVCYIDASAKMIAIAKEKSNNDERVQFIHGTENDIPANSQYDFIIANFYLDLFSDESLRTVLLRIKKLLAPNPQWIVTDFVGNLWWQKVILRAMYFFFRLTCNIESQKLPEWNKQLQSMGGKEVDFKKFYSGFIRTSVFQF
jgi:tRNA (cmo5U34)-methyltransferase